MSVCVCVCDAWLVNTITCPHLDIWGSYLGCVFPIMSTWSVSFWGQVRDFLRSNYGNLVNTISPECLVRSGRDLVCSFLMGDQEPSCFWCRPVASFGLCWLANTITPSPRWIKLGIWVPINNYLAHILLGSEVLLRLSEVNAIKESLSLMASWLAKTLTIHGLLTNFE